MQSIKKLLYIFDGKQKRQFCLLFLVQLIGSFLELFGISMILPIVQAMIQPEQMMQNRYVQVIMEVCHVDDAAHLIMLLIAAMMLLYIAKNLYLVFMVYIKYRIIYHNQKSMEVEVMNIYIHKPYSFHVMRNSAELQRTMLMDIINVFATVDSVFSLISTLITCVLLVVVLLWANALITVGVTSIILLYMLVYFGVLKRRFYLYGKWAMHYGEESLKCINQSFNGIKEVKVYQCEDYFVNSYSTMRARQMSMRKRGGFFRTTPKYLFEMVCIVGILGPIFIEISQGADLTSLISQLSVFAMAAFKLLPSVNSINAEIASIIENKASVDLIYQVIREMREERRQQETETVVCAPEGKGNIELKDVSFCYEGTEKLILDHASLTIEPGKAVAFVGPSGAGKTTTADLILGILYPTQGQILYNGVSIYAMKNDWFSKLGYIPQSIYLCDDTIRNNIAFGHKTVDDAKIWRALEDAQLADFVRECPEGLDSMIGEGGVRISGGQRQRIGIARALYNEPEILVLDEATSALDNETEKAVMEAIDCMKGKRTLIIIAHRLSTIENCDEIYEIKNGEIRKTRG